MITDIYMENVFEYLEYLGYPDLIQEFKEEQVAHSIYNTIQLFKLYGESYRMCAIAIFAFTMIYQVIPSTQKLAEQHKVN